MALLAPPLQVTLNLARNFGKSFSLEKPSLSNPDLTFLGEVVLHKPQKSLCALLISVNDLRSFTVEPMLTNYTAIP